jgi:hypothetical protein
MSNAAGFVGQFFPIFLFGAMFGKLDQSKFLCQKEAGSAYDGPSSGLRNSWSNSI